GGSEHIDQQILGPPKKKDNDKQVTDLFEAAQSNDSVPSTQTTSSSANTNQNIPSENTVSSTTNDNELEEDLLQSALEDSLRLNPSVVIPKRVNSHKSIISSKINTFNDDDNDESDDQGQAFYVGG
ncbi:unnamed protein product, partial [Rotaria sordida]